MPVVRKINQTMQIIIQINYILKEDIKMDLNKQNERILSGKMYNDLTAELVEAREKAVLLTNE